MLIHILDLLRLPVEAKPDDDVVIKPLQLREKIHVEEVNFTYPGSQKQVLEDVTLDIFAGSTTAIAGKTGSGKSTLAHLLMGLLQPDQGRIWIDDVPLTRENRRQWHKSIAYVAQSIFLPDASIADNIVFGRHHEEIDLPRMIDAARKAQLHDFVCSLEAGYDTFVGERGIRLSGGQRQRLGLARAIYKQTPVLLLDEATSALDESTEAAVMDALHELGGAGRTIIIVAHRASTIARCDRVISL